MINKGFILKTAAVASCVVALGVTGCRGGVDEAAAVKNKGTVSIEIHEAKGEDGLNVISERDREETVEAVVRSDGYEGRIAQAEDNDTERDKGESGREQEDKSEAEQPEAEDGITGEEDRGAVAGSSPVGTGEGSENDSAISVSDISDMESEWNESDSSAGWEWGMEDDTAVSEYSDYTDEWYEPDPAGVEAEEDFSEEYTDSGVDESGYSDGAGEWVYYTTALITHYDSGACCCGEYASGYTASGEPAIVGWTCANGALPFGTMVLINGQEYCVTDRGVGADTFDILVGSHDEALARGAYYTDVYVRW